MAKGIESNNMKNRPPRFGEWLLRSFCSYDFLNTALWDLSEMYSKNLTRKGKLRADLIYLGQVGSILYHLCFKGKSQFAPNRLAMVKNNIVLALRGFKKDRSYGLLNIIGLSSGLVLFLLITLYTSYEFGYDQHQKNSDRIYRVYKSVNFIDDPDYRDAGTPGPLANALKEEYPEVAATARLIKYRNILVKAEDQTYVEPTVYPADPSIFDVFSFEVVSGDPAKFLQDEFSVALSESVAMKYFNRTDVVGEAIQFNNQFPMIISGVFKDMPANSHFVMDILVHFESVMKAYQQGLTNWNNNPYFTYLLLEPEVNVENLVEKLPELRAKYADDPVDEDGQNYTYFLQPLSEIYFDQEIEGGLGDSTDQSRLYTFLIIAFSVLIMSIVNFVNISTAKAISRLKTVGIRKVIGAKGRDIINQNIIETSILVLTSLAVAVFITNLLLPAYSLFLDRPLALDFSNLNLWVLLIGLFLMVTLLCGIYPALASAFHSPLNALSGGKSKMGSNRLKNVLVVFQFTVSSVLIISAIVVSRQVTFVDEMDTGYTREHVLILNTRDDNIDKGLRRYMEDLRTISGVETVATSWSLPTKITSNAVASWPGISENERIPMYMVGVTHDFLDLYEIELVEGRNFDRELSTDRKSIILNETAVKAFQWDDPIGKQMINHRGDTGRVIGVAKDFHMLSLKEKIQPLQIVLDPRYATLSVKISGNFNSVISDIERVYDSYEPSYPFEYKRFDDLYDKAYEQEQKTARLSIWFTGLAALIACLGLYGLARHNTHQRKKEIGLRKVMGASIFAVVRLLSVNSFKLLLIALVISVPIAYFVMNNWLNNFAYYVPIDISVFLISFLAMISMMCVTIGYRTYQSSKTNPADVLRVE